MAKRVQSSVCFPVSLGFFVLVFTFLLVSFTLKAMQIFFYVPKELDEEQLGRSSRVVRRTVRQRALGINVVIKRSASGSARRLFDLRFACSPFLLLSDFSEQTWRSLILTEYSRLFLFSFQVVSFI